MRRIKGLRRAAYGAVAVIGWAMAGCAYDAPIGADTVTQATGTLAEVTAFGSNPGGLQMFVYTPAAMPAHAPVVVVMHGCTQTASDYTAAGWSDLADTLKFYVVYPQQQTANNSNRCFRWFDPAQTTRDQGEALSIRQMVDHVAGTYSVDPHRVYVTGLSAGAAMTAVMLATYPDVFAGGAIMSGLPYRCASSTSDAYTCMNPGVDLPAGTWGDRVRAADTGYRGPYPRVSIWHGDADWTVRPANLTALVRQWTNVNGVSDSSPHTESVHNATHDTYVDAAGHVVVESYLVSGMGHGTPVDPTHHCGRAGAYILDEGLCSTALAAHFFGLDGSDGGTPADGGTPTDAGTVTDAWGPTTDASVPAADAGTGTGFTCQEYYDTNWNLVLQGRAMRCGVGGSYVCAVGSGQQFGLWTLVSSWVHETAPGYYIPGRCP